MILRLALVVSFLATALQAQDCRDDTVFLKGDWGQARFAVEIADDAQERAQGLMHRETMPSAAGMLFVYDRPQRLSFWMRNTLIELDMLFIDASGTVRHIHHRAQPLDETPIPGGDNLTHVLEINGGLAEALGITTGTLLRHPTFSKSEAEWAC
ncbi:DUF192 domain-containing protein [Roseobacter sp. EG26]|uniref:DUF192 domain-containing protein n=1 Tax=Roseobacter sp. EG26 TaxID=3412477 RepID=UPI003CE49F3A